MSKLITNYTDYYFHHIKSNGLYDVVKMKSNNITDKYINNVVTYEQIKHYQLKTNSVKKISNRYNIKLNMFIMMYIRLNSMFYGTTRIYCISDKVYMELQVDMSMIYKNNYKFNKFELFLNEHSEQRMFQQIKTDYKVHNIYIIDANKLTDIYISEYNMNALKSIVKEIQINERSPIIMFDVNHDVHIYTNTKISMFSKIYTDYEMYNMIYNYYTDVLTTTDEISKPIEDKFRFMQRGFDTKRSFRPNMKK